MRRTPTCGSFGGRSRFKRAATREHAAFAATRKRCLSAAVARERIVSDGSIGFASEGMKTSTKFPCSTFVRSSGPSPILARSFPRRKNRKAEWLENCCRRVRAQPRRRAFAMKRRLRGA
jgi:hypothetical protein